MATISEDLIAAAWRPNDILPTETVQQHLIRAHSILPQEVSKLSAQQCHEVHAQCHEAKLGGTLLMRA